MRFLPRRDVSSASGRFLLFSRRRFASQFVSLEESRIYIQKEGVRTLREYKQWCREKPRPTFIPSHPEIAYRDTGGWKGYRDWLGQPASWAKSFGRPGGKKNPEENRQLLEHGAAMRKDFIRYVLERRPDFELRTLPGFLNATHLLRRRTEAELAGSDVLDAEKSWMLLQIRFSSVYLHNAKIVRLSPTAIPEVGIVIIGEVGNNVFARRRNEMSMEVRNQSIPVSDFQPREEILEKLDAWYDNGPLLSEPQWMNRISGTPINVEAWKHAGWRLTGREWADYITFFPRQSRTQEFQSNDTWFQFT